MKLSFQDMLKGEEETVSHLVEKVFDGFVAPDLAAEGVEEFKRFIAPEALREKVAEGGAFVITAKDGDDMVGVIAIRENRHIFLFFVHEDFQRKGVARRLFSMALERCRRENPGLTGITVNSSPYAIPIYESLGFVATEPEKVKNGIRHTPMLYKTG
jgi:GNAT superfamily N-acetyltransferase